MIEKTKYFHRRAKNAREGSRFFRVGELVHAGVGISKETFACGQDGSRGQPRFGPGARAARRRIRFTDTSV